MRLNERMSLAAAPPPPARTVTRAQYNKAIDNVGAFMDNRQNDYLNSSVYRACLVGQVVRALDLRVADDTEAHDDA